MNTPGNVLKTEREKQNRSIKDISKELKIQTDYLKAIEENDYKSLPAEVFTKSYMRLYADALNIDSDYIFDLYNNQVNAYIPEEEQDYPARKNITGFSMMIDSVKNIFSACNPAALADIIPDRNPLAAISPFGKHFSYKSVIIAAFMLIIVSVAVVTTREDQKPVTIPEGNVNINVVDTPENKFADIPVADIPAVEEYEEDMVPAKMSLKVVATDITWISASIDDGPPQEWFLRKGEIMTIGAYETFALKIGNAGGTRLLLNGENLGILGAPGKVIDVVIP